MSIKLIARDLYRLQREVERLEKALAEAPMEKRSAIEAQLRKARREKAYVQGALDGQLGRSGGDGK
jgi:hypothetical protein